jgi:TolC family type I secretion outer membrane protein
MLFFLITHSGARAEEVIKKGESLNLQRCVEIALKMHPDIVAAKRTTNVIESRIGQAKANYYPQINLTSGYSRISISSESNGSSLTTGTSGGTGSSSTSGSSSGGDRTFDEYSAGVSLSQTIYDFGKTKAGVRIQSFNFDSSLADLENKSNQVVLNVRQSYYGVLQAKRNLDVSVETVKQFQQHFEQAKGFFEVGVKPKFDVTKAEVDLSNAKLNLIKSQNALRLAVANLNNAMGIPDAPEYSVEDNLLYAKYEILFENAIDRAYKNRPDLISIVAQKQSAEQSIELAKSGYYPVLSGNAGYNWSGEKISSLDHGWNVGATLSFPIFSGFSTKYQLEEAKANLQVLTANEESLKQAIFLEVKQAYLNLKDAEERIPTAELNVKQAEENFEIANGRYAAGVGNPIEVTDASVTLTNAKTSYIQALYDYMTSLASLEKAMGMR